LEFWNFEILHTSAFGFLFVAVSSFFVFVGEDVDFGDNCSIIRASFAPENGVNDVSSSWKMDVWL
jgi:hypothetical protein